ncbi:MAG: metalloregulator ArsR/SmtB family transcription factor [Pseudomonadota bacterium]
MTIPPSNLFNLLADDTRLRALVLLQSEGELCVCELTHALEMSQPKVSRHLAALRHNGVVMTRREANWIYYRMATDLPEWASVILKEVAMAHSDFGPFPQDRERLQKMECRPEWGNMA